jgi:hypothetical protein
MVSEVFSIEGVAEELLEKPVQAKFGSHFMGIVLSQGNFHTEAKHLYIYDLRARSYRGFLDLTAITYS